MTPRARRRLFAVGEFLALVAAAPFRGAGFTARFARDRFGEGYAAEYDWWFGMRQRRETYDLDDQLAERRRRA